VTLSVGSLFSGIGGIDLGLERAGMTVAWQSEVDSYCCRVLKKHWPHVPNLGDVKAIDWAEVPHVDVIAGGYPCQPFSLAGRRLGDQDPRHLWPYMLNALRVLRPRWTLLENVAGHLAMGFGRVLGDLAEVGYDAEWDCVPAAAVGAPHRRDRVYVVAYPQREQGRAQPLGVGGSLAAALAGHDGPNGYVAHADSRRLEIGAELDGQPACNPANGSPQGRHAHRRRDEVAYPDGEGSSRRAGQPSGRPSAARRVEPQRLGSRLSWERPTRRPDWAAEPDVGRVAHGIPARVDRLRALGNAVVPQVAEHIGRLILEAA
jgi:DNA (cytosine-5)-methyltransferase 1